MSAKLLALIVTAAALLLAAMTTGARIYYALSFVLLASMAFSLLSVFWTLGTLRIRLDGLTKRVERGGAFPIKLTAAYFCPLPVAEIRVQIAAPSSGRKPQEMALSAVPFVQKKYQQTIFCPHRGDFEAGIMQVTVTDMLGLFSMHRREKKKTVRVEVLPRVTTTQPLELTPVESGPESILRASDDTASPVDVRKWQDGDELRRVHWKLTMRKREVMVKVFEASGRPDMLVIPDLSPVNALPDQALTYEDAIVEAAIAMTKAQLDNGYAVRMPLVNQHPAELSVTLPQETATVAEQLMRVPFDSPYGFEQVLMTMNSRLGRTGGMALITAQLTVRVADLAIQMRSLGLNVRVIWVTDDQRPEQVQLMGRLEMAGVSAVQVDPYLS